MWKKLRIANLSTGILVAIIVIWTILPIYNVVLLSISPCGEFPISLLDLPSNPTIYYFQKVLAGRESILPYVVNSITICMITTLVVLILAIPASYVFSRYKSRLIKVMFYLMLVLLAIPGITPLLPFFMLIAKLHLMDTIWGVSLAHIAWNLAFATWIMKGFFDQISVELEEAAMIDGASVGQIIVQITFPLIAAGSAVTAGFIFLFSYIEYLYALTLSRSRIITLPVKLAGYMAAHTIYYQEMAVSIIISTVPMVILFAVLQKRIVQGLTLGALKY